MPKGNVSAMQERLLARVSDAKGAYLFGGPGGKPLGMVPYGTYLRVASDQCWDARTGLHYFAVQLPDPPGGIGAIVWASEAGFSIVKGS